MSELKNLEDLERKINIQRNFYHSYNMYNYIGIMYPNSCICKRYLFYTIFDEEISSNFLDPAFIGSYISKCDKDIVVFQLVLYLGMIEGRKMYHSNLLIYYKKTGIFFNFDGNSINDKTMTSLAIRLKKICKYIRTNYKIKCTFRNSIKNSAFHNIMIKYMRENNIFYRYDKLGLWLPQGFCHACSLLFMHYTLCNPNLSISQIYKKIGDNPKKLTNLILNYSAFINTVNKTTIYKKYILHDIVNFNKSKLVKQPQIQRPVLKLVPSFISSRARRTNRKSRVTRRVTKRRRTNRKSRVTRRVTKRRRTNRKSRVARKSRK